MAVNPVTANNLSTAAILGGGGTIPPSGIVPPGPIPAPPMPSDVPPMAPAGPMPPQPSFQDRNASAAALLQGGAQPPELPPKHSLEGPQSDGTYLVAREEPDGTKTVIKVISVPSQKKQKS